MERSEILTAVGELKLYGMRQRSRPGWRSQTGTRSSPPR